MCSGSCTMVAAMTMQQIQPNNQHEPMEKRIPRGAAFVAFVASSEIWTAESNPPIVQMGLSQDSINVQPEGHVVRFSTLVKMYDALFSRCLAPIGKAMIEAKIRTKFINTKTVC